MNKYVNTDNVELEKREIPKEKFVPKIKDDFYIVNYNGEIYIDCIVDEETLKFILKHNLVFKNIEHAEDYKWFLEQLYKYTYDFSKEDWNIDSEIAKYYIYYNHFAHELRIAPEFTLHETINYFKSRKCVETFIDIVGEERIKKYILNIWWED
jgi:hydroxymethylpyrimidine pyrophosphatase-like HAD family hydrolase